MQDVETASRRSKESFELACFAAGVSDQMRFAQFDIYFPISIGFQILALPGFVKLADIFGYAEAKAQKELQNALLRADSKHDKSKLQSISTGGSLISAESIRAGMPLCCGMPVIRSDNWQQNRYTGFSSLLSSCSCSACAFLVDACLAFSEIHDSPSSKVSWECSSKGDQPGKGQIVTAGEGSHVCVDGRLSADCCPSEGFHSPPHPHA